MANHCKTVSIVALIEKVNAFCLNSADNMKAEREAMATFLADILHQNNVYAGFGYLYAHHMEKSERGTSVGIIFDESPERKHVYPDESRVYYCVSRKLEDPDRIKKGKTMPKGMETIRLTNAQANVFFNEGMRRQMREWLEARRCSIVYTELEDGRPLPKYGAAEFSGFTIGTTNANTLLEFKLAWL